MRRVSVVQVSSPPAEPVDARRTRVGAMVADAAGADLVVLPELWAPGYFVLDRYPELAEPLDGDTVSAGREWAKRLRCFLQMGSVLERGRGGALHNTAVLIDPTGEIALTYRKMHVFGYRSREAELLHAGTKVEVADTALGPIGMTTCYDLRFSDLWQALIDAGVETVLVPAAWPAARRDHWRLFTSCRAVEEQIVVVACNAVGTQEGTWARRVQPSRRSLGDGARRSR